MAKAVKAAAKAKAAKPAAKSAAKTKKVVSAPKKAAKAPAAQKAMGKKAPTDMPAVAKRLNPLKASPLNQKIHASAKSRTKRAQAKRDAR